MSGTRLLSVMSGEVPCTQVMSEPVEKCRFCVHSVRFKVQGVMVDSPARAYCLLNRTTTQVQMSDVEVVECDDLSGEGFRSMMNVIG